MKVQLQKKERGTGSIVWACFVLAAINTGLVACLVFFIVARDRSSERYLESVDGIHKALDRMGVPAWEPQE